MRVYSSKGQPLDATIQIELRADGPRIVFESSGPGRNRDYILGFDTVLTRLAGLSAILRDATVVSKETQRLPPNQRRLHVTDKHYPFRLTSAEEAIATARSLRRAAAAVGRPAAARGGGNPTKRVEIRFVVPRRARATLAWLTQQIVGPAVSQRGNDWSKEEARLAVADYFDMLKFELSHRPYVKAEHNRLLRGKLRSRTKGSVERKYQNISSVLNDLGLPFIDGYKPLSNVQGLLREVVCQYLDENPTIEKGIIRILNMVPDRVVAPVDCHAALVLPPSSATAAPPARRRLARKFDFAGLDARNRSLGLQGELWVMEFERARLRAGDCGHLVEVIEHVSKTQGDGLGYDIHSKNLDGSDRFIEVKTTNGNCFTAFLVTANELDCSRESGSSYHVYRVFEFSFNPRLFIISGPLDESVQLEPTEYRVRFKPSE
jgi:hypothetical protein